MVYSLYLTLPSYLGQYAEAGGSYTEIAYERCGQSPYLEQTAERARLIASL